jgi:microsomal dipeptidase-like Zn-dependent dipeptidase
MTSIDEMSEQIRGVGPERCILSTDFGQVSNPSPIKGFEEFIGHLVDRGFSDQEIRKMIKENPSFLVGF